jgi:hypothetical protein
LNDLLAVLSGSLVGFSLGLIGGGGSILAVPLLLYVVGIRNVHLAIGTSSLAVALNAFANLVPHARRGNVAWGPAAIFASVGVLGVVGGSVLGKMVNGQRLLFLFALLMLVVAGLMLRGGRESATDAPSRGAAPWLGVVGLGAGGLSGFFGIGGGFLIVPALIFAGGMPTVRAIGSSLLAVGAFGIATAASYAYSGLVDWPVAGEFILGGVAGGWGGAWLAARLAGSKTALNRIFAGVLVAVALYMLYRSFGVPVTA